MKKLVIFSCIILSLVVLASNVAIANCYVPSKYPYVIAPNENNRCGHIPYFDYSMGFYPHENRCVLEKGWHTNSNGKFYYNNDGTICKNGWYWINGKRYKFDCNGYVYRNKWIKDECTGSWYFVDCDGATSIGWKNIDNVWYYFNPEGGAYYGIMSRNTVMYINDNKFGSGYFAFNDDGSLVSNSWYRGYYYGPNGTRMY